MQAQFLHASVVRQREFTCGACSARRTATVTGIGEGAATELNSAGTLERRAQEAAEKDVDDTLAVAACPSCGARSSAGVRRWWWRNAGLPLAIILPLMGLCAFGPYLFDLDMRERDKVIVVWVMLGISLLVCGVMSLPLLMKWSSAKARVRWE